MHLERSASLPHDAAGCLGIESLWLRLPCPCFLREMPFAGLWQGFLVQESPSWLQLYGKHKELNELLARNPVPGASVIRKEHLRRAKNLLIEFSGRIGGWRHEKSKNIVEPTEQWTPKKNELIPINDFKNETRPTENEWGTESIAKEIVTHNPMMIRSKYARRWQVTYSKAFQQVES